MCLFKFYYIIFLLPELIASYEAPYEISELSEIFNLFQDCQMSISYLGRIEISAEWNPFKKPYQLTKYTLKINDT